MPLTLVIGPANSAKAGEVLGAYADVARSGALLVVPTAADAGYYARELAERGCVIGSVLTFAGLVDEIARRTGYRAVRLSALQREQVARRALAGCRFGVIGRAAATRGFLTAALRLIGELEREMISVPRFAAALDRWAHGEEGRQGYARDLAALYSAYSSELERLGAVDAELFAWRALDALRSAPGRWGGDPVYLYGFDDLHGLERDAVETLARIVDVEVTVSLTYETGRPALSARAELVGHLRELAARVVELPPADDYYEGSSRAVLYHLERTLFQGGQPGERPNPGQAIQLLEAGGELAEAELVAEETSKLLAAGFQGDDIVVLRRRLDPAATEALTRAFARRGIPAWVQRMVPFGHSSLGRGVLALARLAAAGPAAPAQDVVDYVRTPGMLRSPARADELELEIRRRALTDAAQALDALGLQPAEITAVAQASDPLAELTAQARRLLAAPRRGCAPLLSAEAELDARAVAVLARSVDELAEVGERPSVERLAELLAELKVPAGAGSPPAGAVTVADPLGVRARRFRAVFVCGLQEGLFPSAPPPDPFLPDERRRELAAIAGLRLPRRESALDRERYLFYASLSRATERVFLSFQSSDEEGNPTLPSPFIDDVAEVLDPSWWERRRRRPLVDVVEDRLKAGVRDDPDGSTGCHHMAVAPPRRLAASALARARHTQVLSAGALECYAACPMRWLVERELRPVTLEPPPEALARGGCMHEVLERVMARLGGPVTPDSLPTAIELLEQAIDEASARLTHVTGRALRRAAMLAVLADLRRYLEFEASCGLGWPPRALELRFGFEEEESLPPLRLGEGETAITVRGAIDRVDVEPGSSRAVIRDYKSGPARVEHQGSRWRSERQLQVALYMLAVRQLLGLDPVAGLYQPLGGKDLYPRGLWLDDVPVPATPRRSDACDPAALEAELEDACRRAVALAAALRAGELVPSPATCSRDGCRYPGICRAQ